MKNFIFFLLITIASLLTQCLTMLPFYTYLIPCTLISFIFRYKKISVKPFYMGALSGFFIGVGMTLFFHTLYQGQLLVQTAQLFKVNTVVLFFIIGLLAAILSGLSCFIGYSVPGDQEETKKGM